ncbi:hypothetical protein OSB04_015127 [Centaurea solstitialis]|uniref:XS domain-containing protein n=1 Tax=Centaurea solstitialis TaxID=347529 RepID=A0AA38TGN2_9ASTR|nr:hypothetical protein OSB04_015127 [Centaurea solstitialis]
MQMASSGGGGWSNGGGAAGGPVSGTDVEQLNLGFGDMSLDSTKTGCWDALCKENKKGDGWREWCQDDDLKTGNGPVEFDDGSDSDEVEASEDELLTDDYDSDDSLMSHDSRKKNPWFAELFGTLDDLSCEEISEPARQWHCPACQNGPGSIYWFRSMKSFLTHIKTKGTRRPKLHRDLAELMDEELCRRGVTLVPAGEAYGEWEGVKKDVQDEKIVWPPMVIVMNTQLKKDEKEKWIGMGTQELLDYFASYEPVRARHSFGPEGHRGMSVLIFETSAVGYLEAERLSNHFKRQGTDRDAWDHHPNLFHPGGKRQLYGYMATERDLDVFNQYSSAKFKLKFELVSHQEKVVDHLKQMNKDCQQLHWYKKKVAKQERNSKALEDAFWLLSRKLRKLEEGTDTVNAEEVECDPRLRLPRRRQEVEKSEVSMLTRVFLRESLESFFKGRGKEVEEIEEERERLVKLHEKEMAEMKRKHAQEEIEMEERCSAKLDRLMEKCSQWKN